MSHVYFPSFLKKPLLPPVGNHKLKLPCRINLKTLHENQLTNEKKMEYIEKQISTCEKMLNHFKKKFEISHSTTDEKQVNRHLKNFKKLKEDKGRLELAKKELIKNFKQFFLLT